MLSRKGEEPWLTRLTIVFFSITFCKAVVLVISPSKPVRSTGTWIQIFKTNCNWLLTPKLSIQPTSCAKFRDAVVILVHVFLPSWYLDRMNTRDTTMSSYSSHLSYAEDVRNEMTKPRTVPSTVNSWFEIPKSWTLSEITDTTTYPTRMSVVQSATWIQGHKTLTCGNDTEEKNLRPYVVDNSGLKLFGGEPTPKQGIWRYHPGSSEEKKKKVCKEGGVWCGI